MKKPLFAGENALFGKGKKNRTSWLNAAEHSQVTLQIRDEMTLKQLEMIGLSSEELKIAKAIQPLIVEHIEEIVASFYQTITNVQHLKEIIMTHSTLERLRKTLEQHLIEMFSGQIDQEYLEKRIKIADIHYKIGLEPKWYMGAFQNLQASLLQIVHNNIEDRYENLRVSQVITKILNFEQQLVLEAYEGENARQRQLQYDEIKRELKAKIFAVCEEMALIAERANAAVQELVASSELVNKSVLLGAETSRDTQQLAMDGQGKLSVLKTRIDSVFDRANHLKMMVEQLNVSVQEMDKVVGLVQTVANDTNLLSLNSSIEAARAGEHGAGFAVVSNEIRKLSGQTKASVEQIKTYINETQQFTTKVVSVIADVRQFVQDGKSESDAAELTFNQILASMSTNLKNAETVEDGIGTLVHNIKEISETMEKVSESAETLYVAVDNF